MSVQTREKNNEGDRNPKGFSEWLLRIGDGRKPGEDSESEWKQIPDSILLQAKEDHIHHIFESTYECFDSHKHDKEYLTNRAILTPKKETVDEINEYIMGYIDGEEREYLSCDTIDKSTNNFEEQSLLHQPEYLNRLHFSGIPEHILKLKVGVPIMLLQDLLPSTGLCKGTRLVVKHLGMTVMAAEIISGSNVGEIGFIPRIDFRPSDTGLPFVLKRRQFPVRVCYAMTIDESQGQTLEKVGLYLPRPVFSHGQFNIALPRVKSPTGLKILPIEDEEEYKGWTKNIVYCEVSNGLTRRVGDLNARKINRKT